MSRESKYGDSVRYVGDARPWRAGELPQLEVRGDLVDNVKAQQRAKHQSQVC